MHEQGTLFTQNHKDYIYEEKKANALGIAPPKGKKKRHPARDREGKEMKEPTGKEDKYKSIVQEPLVQFTSTEGRKFRVIHVIGSMVLHMCLGVRKDALDMLEDAAREIDKTIKDWSEFSSLLQRSISTARIAHRRAEQDLPSKLRWVKLAVKALEGDHYGWALRKRKENALLHVCLGSQHINQGATAQEIQADYSALVKEE